MPAIAHILSQYKRPQIESFITVAIGLLDVFDGDPDDQQSDGDDDDGDSGEDDFMDHSRVAGGPGCPVADSDYCTAGEDRGSERGQSDGRPGDPDDAEEGGDIELNGDEGDHDGGEQ